MPHAEKTATLSPRSGVLASLILIAVAYRLVGFFAPHLIPPNFTPVEAIALFGGAYFADRRLAFLLPLAAMLIADAIIGLHGLIPVVYACIALTVLLGFNLRRRVAVLPVIGYGLVGSVLFFVVTNFAVWLSSGMYPLDGAGLVACYVAAIPFFKNTLFGTLLWSGILFGGFELLQRRYPRLAEATA